MNEISANNPATPADSASQPILDLAAIIFSIVLKDGRQIEISNATSYQPEGPLTTFFSTGSSRQTLDSWATRVSSYRTADIVAIERTVGAAFVSQPVLVAV